MIKTDSVVDPAADETAAGRRRKFYGRRKGRKLRDNQQGWIDDLLPALTVALPAAGGQVNPADLFSRPMDDIWLEIGFGGGEHLAAQAVAYPEIGIIGCEVFLNGIASLLGHLDAQEGDNVRIYPEEHYRRGGFLWPNHFSSTVGGKQHPGCVTARKVAVAHHLHAFRRADFYPVFTRHGCRRICLNLLARQQKASYFTIA